jgi:thiamine-phosphate pyrophosphorylase
VLLCYITDRSQLRGELIARIDDTLRAGVDLIQIREKDLSGRDLHALCAEALLLPNPHGTRILVNARADVALAAGAHGLHLPSNSPAPSSFRGTLPAGFLIGVSCHSLEDVRRAEAEGADYVVFGPVFETPSKAGYGLPQGIERLRQACEAVDLPVLALGGIGVGNAASCLRAGAAGIAGISLFQKAGDLSEVIRALRDLGDRRGRHGMAAFKRPSRGR